MLAKYFLLIRNYVLSVYSERKYNFYHQIALLDAFRTNSRNIIGRNPSMVIPLLANQDLTPMLASIRYTFEYFFDKFQGTRAGKGRDGTIATCRLTGGWYYRVASIRYTFDYFFDKFHGH